MAITAAPLRIVYRFELPPDIDHTFEVELDPTTLTMPPPSDEASPPWTRLEFNKCSHCPLSADTHPLCPPARNLARVAETFRFDLSHATAKVTVVTADRTYLKTGPLAGALQGLFGLVMATSGCPHMDFLKPMARFHLPFATMDDTIIRATSMHLLGQYVRMRRGGPEAFDLAGLRVRYNAVAVVNRGIVARIGSLDGRDVNKNALVTLGVFGKMLDYEIKDDMPLLDQLFPIE